MSRKKSGQKRRQLLCKDGPGAQVVAGVFVDHLRHGRIVPFDIDDGYLAVG